MSKPVLYTEENIAPVIYYIRGEKVMLDRDLAMLYSIETKRLKEAVRRNIDRFPADFMFELTQEEFQNWRTQFDTSNNSNSSPSLRTQIASLKNDIIGEESKRGKHIKYLPFAFTEQGIAMLSSVINAPRAIEVNIAIMRTFVKMRKILLQNVELMERMRELEETVGTKFSQQDEKFDIIFEAISSLNEQPQEPRRPIGFNEPATKYGKSPKIEHK